MERVIVKDDECASPDQMETAIDILQKEFPESAGENSTGELKDTSTYVFISHIRNWLELQHSRWQARLLARQVVGK